VLHDINVIRRQAITNTIVTGNLQTDGLVSKAVAVAKRIVGPAPPPFWLKIDGLISEEDAMIQSAFENKRSISADELKRIISIREQRNGFVIDKFLDRMDPRKVYSMTFPYHGGGSKAQPIDALKEEVARRAKDRAEHPPEPKWQNAMEEAILYENEDIRKGVLYYAKTKYTASQMENNTRYIRMRRNKTIGMEIWNALLVHDTLTQSCFERADGTRIMSNGEYDKLKENVDDLKFLVRILTMDVK
jgi:hypothetical protein